MTDQIDELMGYNPKDLDVFQETTTNSFDVNIYKTNPKDSTSKDGHYHSKIRVIYNPFNPKKSILISDKSSIAACISSCSILFPSLS